MKKLSLFAGLLVLLSLLTSPMFAAELFNGDFEILAPGVSEADALSLSPFGWVATNANDDWTLRLSKDVVAAGKYSMEIVAEPGSTRAGVHLASKPFPVEPGKQYTVSVKALNLNEPPFTGRVDLYVEFWPEGGWWGETDYWSEDSWKEQVRGAWTGTNRIGVVWTGCTAMNDWGEFVVTGQAPANAKYLTVSFWTSSRVLKSYIDDIRVEEK